MVVGHRTATMTRYSRFYCKRNEHHRFIVDISLDPRGHALSDLVIHLRYPIHYNSATAQLIASMYWAKLFLWRLSEALLD